MKAVLEHFHRIGDAPDAITRLRQFILDLAVRGKLVPQDPNDEPASQLLKRIATEKARAEKTMRSTRPDDPEPISPGQEPFEIPPNWIWTRLGAIAELVRGISFPGSVKSTTPGPGLLPCFRSGNVQSEVIWGDLIFVPRIFIKSNQQLVRDGDILISIANSYALVGKCAIVKYVQEKATFGAFLAAIRLYVASPEYLRHFLSSEYSANEFRIGSAQTTNIANITFGTIRDHMVSLPPLAEQHRIVPKVDELMALCDGLEAARAERESKRDRLAAASLARLNEPDPDRGIFADDARFALENLAALTTRPEQVKQLRQTILNLAVRGHLVPQDSNEEPVSGLLHRIQSEKVQLVKEGLIREHQPLASTHGASSLSQIPSSWKAVRLIDVAYLRSGIAVQHGDELAEGDIPYVKVADLSIEENRNGLVTSTRFVTKKYSDAIIHGGSIVFPKRGGAIATNRKRVSYVDIVCDSNLMAMRPFLDEMRPYLLLWFRRLDLWELNSGTSVPQINNKDIYPLFLPLPPLAEQHRIVAKVDELMALCDRLEANLTLGQDHSRRLLETLLAQALSPAEELMPAEPERVAAVG